jgi:uncharacterized protein DUF6444
VRARVRARRRFFLKVKSFLCTLSCMKFKTYQPLEQFHFLFQECEYLRTTNQSLLKQNVMLAEEIKKLSIKVHELEERLNTNSNNSSKPPSQDPFHEPRRSPPTGRKPGGQLGHPRHTRKMIPLDQVSRVIEVKPESCSRCGARLTEADSILVKHRQVVELSTVFSDVTQYNVHPGAKQACLAHIRRDFIKVSERINEDGAIGRILCDQLDAIFALWHQYAPLGNEQKTSLPF